MNENCRDCGIYIYDNLKNDYMVLPKIWNKYGLGVTSRLLSKNVWTEDEDSGKLCMSCLEDRLGRKIKKSDLMNTLSNRENPYIAKLLK